jgi:hypothetical protein
MCASINEHTVRVDLLLADRRVDEASIMIDHINEQGFTHSQLVCTPSGTSAPVQSECYIVVYDIVAYSLMIPSTFTSNRGD